MSIKNIDAFVSKHFKDVSAKKWNAITAYAKSDSTVTPAEIVELFLLDILGMKENPEEIMLRGNIKIPNNFCENSQRITSFKVPDNIISIGDDAFKGCQSLQEIDLNHVKEIGDSAFEDCKNLRTLRLGDSLESIGAHAFLHCRSLRQVIVPKSLKYIGDKAFEGCLGILLVFEPETLEDVNISNSDVAWLESGDHVAVYDDSPSDIEVLDAEEVEEIRDGEAPELGDKNED